MIKENCRAAVLSTNGIGAFELISWKSMFEALMKVCARMFYGQPSSYLWKEDDGTVHHIEQGSIDAPPW